MAGQKRGSGGRAAASIISLCFAAMLLGPPDLRAAAIASGIKYSTEAWIGSPWAESSSAVPIGFWGVTEGTTPAGGALDLGSFLVTTPPGMTTTFSGTPFGIVFHAPQFDGFEPSWLAPEGYTTFKQSYGRFTVLGHLDGTVSAEGGSDVVAKIDDVVFGPHNLPLPTAGIHVSGLPFSKSALRLPGEIDLSAGPGGYRSAGVKVEMVPEPTSALVLLLAGSTAYLWRLRRLGAARRDSAS